MNPRIREIAIKKAFQKIKIPVKLSERPIGMSIRGRGLVEVDSDSIFQMSIETKRGGTRNKRGEYFKIWLGDNNNDIRVLDVDSKLQQLLLYVKEPAREFTRRTRSYNHEEIRKLTTDNSVRKYLVGMDERHLFVAQLPEKERVVNKVSDAHRDLKPPKLWKSTVQRQGEYFFVEIDEDEKRRIEKSLKTFTKNTQDRVALRFKDKPIAHVERLYSKPANFGNPHIAEDILAIDEDSIYVKGKIRHKEHTTINLLAWHKVYRNTELDLNEDRDKVEVGTFVFRWID